MRVAHVLPVYSDSGLSLLGGGERYAFNLAGALEGFCDVTLVTFGPRRRLEQLNGFRHLIVPANGRDPVNPVPHSKAGFLHERFDIVHAYQLRTTVTSLLSVICRVTRTPLIVTDLGSRIAAPIDRLQLFRLVPRFIAISEYAKALLPQKVIARTTVVKGGVDLSRFSYHEGPRCRQVVQIGRIMPHKGINYLIDAAGRDIDVVIAGKVLFPEYYSELLQRSGGKRIRFVIDPSDQQVTELYQRSAVTVAASVYRDLYGDFRPHSELLGLTLLESMAVGTPVVCTNVGGMPEYVTNGETGFVVPPNDSRQLRERVTRLVGDPDLVRRMGRASRVYVQQFGWQRVAEQVHEQYLQLRRPRLLEAGPVSSATASETMARPDG
jgi:alpha-maltose-1-phosphate synthase